MTEQSGGHKSAGRVELTIGFIILFLLALIPVIEAVLRGFFNNGLPGSDSYVRHLVLIVACVGGMITSADRRHLSISIGTAAIPDTAKPWIEMTNAFFTVTMNIAFAVASLAFVLIGLDGYNAVGVIPVQLFGIVMPFAFTVMGIRGITAVPETNRLRNIAWAGIPLGLMISFPSIIEIIQIKIPDLPGIVDVLLDAWYGSIPFLTVPLVVLLIAAGLLGVPIFIVLGGIAFLLFAREGSPLAIIPNSVYGMLTDTMIPAIPLFTFAGFILSESKAGERLVRLFKSLFGWLPGGLVIMAIVVSAFFTTFTGASGVTILALGALLSLILLENGRYSEKFTTGLLTSVGSVGLLFPPSLPMILYGVSAQISIVDMFKGGLLPGIVMILIISVFGIIVSIRSKVPIIRFRIKEALSAILGSIWEILLPVIVVAGYFTGLLSLVETAAVSVVYALFIEVVIRREIRIRDLPNVALKSLPIIGGVLMILALSTGLQRYIIDVEVPMMLSKWVSMHIHSRFVFLLLLNIALLITGCFMDIYSAILVVVPLITPLGSLFGIHPVHLGIIFITNMELGFLTPPVGMNLFLSSYRFNKPLMTIYKDVIPFLLIQLVILLIITYVPWFSTAFIGS